MRQPSKQNRYGLAVQIKETLRQFGCVVKLIAVDHAPTQARRAIRSSEFAHREFPRCMMPTMVSLANKSESGREAQLQATLNMIPAYSGTLSRQVCSLLSVIELQTTSICQKTILSGSVLILALAGQPVCARAVPVR